MYTHIYKIIVLFSLVFVMVRCDLSEDDTVAIENTSAYELLIETTAQNDLYVRKNLIDLFVSIALDSEYGSNLPLVKKWIEPMKILVTGDKDSLLMYELSDIIVELNSYFTDGFYIKQVSENEEHNFHIFLGDGEDYAQMYPEQASYVDTNAGLFRFSTDADLNITYGHMYVDVDRNVRDINMHLLREELTQSLGLPMDIKYYSNSIFYVEASRVQSYSDYDIEVIRLLYHPSVTSGIGETNVRSILENILNI